MSALAAGLAIALAQSAPLTLGQTAQCYVVSQASASAYAKMLDEGAVTPADRAHVGPFVELEAASANALRDALQSGQIVPNDMDALLRQSARDIANTEGGSEAVARACWSAFGIGAPGTGVIRR